MLDYEQEVQKRVAEYIGEDDWRVKENANTGRSYANLMGALSGLAIATYARKKVYTEEIASAHDQGYMHIHDLSGAIAGYCAGWGLQGGICDRGFIGLDTVAHSGPARHVRSICNHIVNFLGSMSNEWAGAQAFSSVDTVLAGYVASDVMQAKRSVFPDGCDPETEARFDAYLTREIAQELQSVVYHLNYPTRWGGQSPFSNMTVDLQIPQDMCNLPVLVGRDAVVQDGRQITYGMLQEQADLVNRAIFDCMAKGDAASRPFTFPVLTANITQDVLDGKLNPAVMDSLLEATRKYGSFYFQNCVHGESNRKPIDPTDVRAMCCRLSLSITDLLRHTGGLFGHGDKTGSLGVVTLSLPMLAYEARREAASPAGAERLLFDKIDRYFDTAVGALELKRSAVVSMYNAGMFPFTKVYLFDGAARIEDYPTHFSTVGYVGMHDALLNLGLRHGIVDEQGVRMSERIQERLLDRAEETTVKTGHLYNIEATPAEGSSYRLARHGVAKYADMIHSGTPGTDNLFFTNSCHPPVEMQNDLLFLLEHQDRLQRLHSGGTVVHLYVSGTLSKESAQALIRKVCQTRIPYFSITPVVSVCPKHGYVPGEHLVCPICARLAAEYDAAHQTKTDPA